MELALLLQLVLLQLDLTPPDTTMAAPPGQHEACTECKGSSAVVSLVRSLLPKGLQQHLQQVAVFGLGSGGGSSLQARQWLASGAAASGEGGACGVRLPPFDLQRLVGFKVPAESWVVGVAGREQQA